VQIRTKLYKQQNIQTDTVPLYLDCQIGALVSLKNSDETDLIMPMIVIEFTIANNKGKNNVNPQSRNQVAQQ